MTPEELIEQAARKIADESGWSWSCSAEYCEHCDCVAGWVDGTIEQGQRELRKVAAPVVALVLKAAAEVARAYSNARPGDIAEVMAGDWQEAIAQRILSLSPESRTPSPSSEGQ